MQLRGNADCQSSGPTVVDVVIDCSRDGQLWPNILWFPPFVSLLYHVEDILARNATVMPWGEGTGETVVQLVVYT